MSWPQVEHFHKNSNETNGNYNDVACLFSWFMILVSWKVQLIKCKGWGALYVLILKRIPSSDLYGFWVQFDICLGLDIALNSLP